MSDIDACCMHSNITDYFHLKSKDQTREQSDQDLYCLQYWLLKYDTDEKLIPFVVKVKTFPLAATLASAGNLCKQLGPRSGPEQHWS